MWAAALGLVFGVALPANAQIIRAITQVHGCEMS
jgi:hypothetical protein